MLTYPITNRLHSFLMCKVVASSNNTTIRQASTAVRILDQGYLTASDVRTIKEMGYKSKQEEFGS